MKQILVETDSLNKEDFLAAALRAWEEDAKASMETLKKETLNEATKKIREFFSLYWKDEDFVDFSTELFKTSLLVAVNDDGINDALSGVGVDHHTLTKSNKSAESNKSAKTNETNKSNETNKLNGSSQIYKPSEPADHDTKPAHDQIKINRHNEPITLTAYSKDPIDLNLLSLINSKPIKPPTKVNKPFESAAKPSKEDESISTLLKLINSLR
jgi:hypothetical protein